METVKGWYQTWCDFPQPKKVKIIKGAAFVCFSLFLLFLVIYAFGGTGKKSKTLTPTIIFMESMPADLQTLRYLAQRRDFSIGMVVLTVSGWVNNLDAAYDNLAALLQLFKKEGYTKTFPIYYGSSVAVADDAFFSNVSFSEGVPVPASTTSCTYRRVLTETLSTNAQRLFNGATLLDLVALENPQSRLTHYDSPLSDYLASKKATFLVLGPATDAAAFLQNHPERRGQIQRIVMGGGALVGQGDAQYLYPENRYAEVSFFLDPAAADYIVQGPHGRPVTIVSLEAAQPWSATVYDTLIASRSSTSAAAEDEVTSANVVGVALAGYYEQVGSSSKPISLALLAGSLLADTYLQDGSTVSRVPVKVLSKGGLVVEGRAYRPPSGSANVNVVLGVKLDTFVSHLVRVDALPFE